MKNKQHYVYILKSLQSPQELYTGLTSDLKRRLNQHNQGSSKHTAKFKPWKIHAAFWFSKPEIAIEFEKYLKSGSGRAFRNKHF